MHMESIGTVLGRYKQPESDEVASLKQFITTHFQVSPVVAVRGNALVITVSSAALANTLRLKTVQLQAACKTTKRLVFRIGS